MFVFRESFNFKQEKKYVGKEEFFKIFQKLSDDGVRNLIQILTNFVKVI